MKIKVEEDRLVVCRNKRKGIKLKIIRITGTDWIVCEKCDLYLSCYKNSLCNSHSFYLCEEVKDRGLGNYYFNLEG